MEVSGTNPFKFLVVTRVWACILMVPLLNIAADAVGLLGSYFIESTRGEGNLGYLLQNDGIEEEVNQLGNNLDTLIRVRADAVFKELELSSTALRSSSQKVEVLMSALTEEKGIRIRWLKTLRPQTT